MFARPRLVYGRPTYGSPAPPLYVSDSMLHGEGLLTMGADGWTEFQPSTDSRIMYVSEDGNDATGAIYAHNSFTDPFEPTGENAYETFAAAFADTRDGYPDWVLLRRGDTFSNVATITPRSGRSSSEYSLIGAYGTTGAAPLVHPSPGSTMFYVEASGANVQYVAVANIDFYSITRNPEEPTYNSAHGGTYVSWIAANSYAMRYILYEGVTFRFFTGGSMQAWQGVLNNVVFRRNVIRNNYAGNNSGQLYIDHSSTMLFEENIFDHNGWYSQAGSGGPGEAYMMNHHLYFNSDHGTYSNISVLRNIFSRVASSATKFRSDDTGEASNITIKNNLYVDGEVGISIGGNTTAAYRFVNVTVEDNVFTEIGRSEPTNRNLGWALDAQDWDGGVIEGNYFLHSSNPAVTNIYAILLDRTARNVDVAQNVIYGLNPHGNNSSVGFFRVGGGTKTNLSISNNDVYEPNNSAWLVTLEATDQLGQITLSGNRYYSANESSAFRFGSTTRSFAQWVSDTGDDSTFGAVTYHAPTRSLATYMSNLGEDEDIEEFFTAIRAQGRYSWDLRFTASVVNTWLKAGFTGA